MVVGNIVNCDKEVDTRYFNCLTIDDYVASTHLGYHPMFTLPTLIIGWSNVKEYYKDVSILSKVIEEESGGFGATYWTFSKSEKRGIFEEDLNKFKLKCYEDLVKGLKTYNIDPIIYKINTTDELCNKISKLTGGTGYLFQDRIVYIYKGDSIYVIDLELIDYIGFDRSSIIECLKSNLSVFGDNFEEKFTEELKHLDIKYTPYLEFKNEV